MYPQLRAALLLAAAIALLVTGRCAMQSTAARIAILRTWQRTEGTLAGMPDHNFIEVELGRDADSRRVTATADHMLGLSLFHTVTVYHDPARPDRYVLGGRLQNWLWPATLFALAVLLCAIAVWVAAAGRATGVDDSVAAGQWRFAAPPPVSPGDIAVRPPSSEVAAPLFWSLLGVAAFCCGVFIPNMAPFPRLAPLLAGSVFVTGTWLLAVHNRTFRVSAGGEGLRAASALGWRQVPWSEVKSVERRELRPTTYRAFQSNSLPFPGNTTQSIVFTGAGGRTLLRMSTKMQPRDAVSKLFALCAARTGLTEQFRRIDVPDL